AKDVEEKKIKGAIQHNASIEEVQSRHENLSQTCSAYDREIGAIEQSLKHDDENRKRQGAKIKELETLKKELELYDIIKEYIGDEKGKKFSKIMQRFTLRHLIALANQRLQEISGRYILHVSEQSFSDDDKGVDQLMVVDREMGDAMRIVSTLSGGESFLVSLALALALSDLAAGNIQIRSFFIDEGFGTLDPASLDMAISTLEKIQAEDGKTVGIISHVDTLKERIACQVKVIKGSSGFSRIETVV
ncbi:MAG: SbcC/MukB-like Walker B domain-containing protein, partial [Cytophagaceae bacterium]